MSRKAVADTPDLLSENLVISRNSIVSYTNILEEAFPKGSTMTVWYNPQNPRESYVERFCNKDKLYKKLALSSLNHFYDRFCNTYYFIYHVQLESKLRVKN